MDVFRIGIVRKGHACIDGCVRQCVFDEEALRWLGLTSHECVNKSDFLGVSFCSRVSNPSPMFRSQIQYYTPSVCGSRLDRLYLCIAGNTLGLSEPSPQPRADLPPKVTPVVKLSAALPLSQPLSVVEA